MWKKPTGLGASLQTNRNNSTMMRRLAAIALTATGIVSVGCQEQAPSFTERMEPLPAASSDGTAQGGADQNSGLDSSANSGDNANGGDSGDSNAIAVGRSDPSNNRTSDASTGGSSLESPGEGGADQAALGVLKAHILAQSSDGNGIERTFTAGRSSEPDELAFRLDGQHTTILLTMADQVHRGRITHRQMQRTHEVETFQQGSVEREGQESFTQAASPRGPLDILVIVDNSGSMKEEQANLASKLSSLLGYVQDSDWRISVETTDPADSCGQHIISKGATNASQLFSKAVTRGTSGSGNERGVLQAVNGLKCGGGSWLRQNSKVAILIVSDEDNCSNGTSCGSDPWASETYLLNHLSSIRQVKVDGIVYGLFWQPTQATCKDAYSKATVYQKLVDATDGYAGSICSSDYSGTLNEVSKNLGQRLNTQFSLKYPAVASTLEVSLNGVVLKSGYSLAGNVIVFDQAPEPGDQISVNYHYRVNDPQDTFRLAKKGSIDNVEVFLDGTKAASGSFSVVPEDGIVRFPTAPSATEVRISYRVGEAPGKDFSFEHEGQLMSINVTVNGISEGAFTLGSKTISFETPPPDGAVINLDYVSASGFQDRYRHFVPDDAIASLEVSDAQSGETVSHTIQGDFIVFSESDFVLGRQISLKFPYGDKPMNQIDLGEYAGRVNRVYTSSLTCPVDQYNHSGTVLDIQGCGFKAGDLVIAGFAPEPEQRGFYRFVLSEDAMPGEIPKSWFVVTIDGVSTSDYTISQTDGLALEFANLAFGKVVVVKLVPRLGFELN